MEPTVKRTSESKIELFDTQGRLIGVVVRPVTDAVVGPGAEKVYVARQRVDARRGSQAA